MIAAVSRCSVIAPVCDDGTQLRKRVLAAFDHHRFIRALSDEQAAQVIRDDEIDVLIELNGITEGSRLPVLAMEAGADPGDLSRFHRPSSVARTRLFAVRQCGHSARARASYQPAPLADRADLSGQRQQAHDRPSDVSRRGGLPEEPFCSAAFQGITKSPRKCSPPGCRFCGRRPGRCCGWRRTMRSSAETCSPRPERAGIARSG